MNFVMAPTPSDNFSADYACQTPLKDQDHQGIVLWLEFFYLEPENCK